MDDHRDDQTHAWQHVKQLASQEASYRGLGDWRTLPVVTELIEQHVRVMQRCFEDSTDQARQRLVVAFASIELRTVINGLLAAIKQMMLIYVGTISIGAAISAAMSGGIGIAAGAAVGIELGTIILGVLGLKCLADVFVKSLTVLVSDYAHGVRDAWEAVAYDRHSQAVVIDRFKITSATWKLASAHVALVESLLLAIVAYLSKGQLKTLAAEARTGKLGNAFADWLEQHGNQLKDHPVLVPHHLKPVLLDDGTLISAEEWNARRAMRRVVAEGKSPGTPSEAGLHNQTWNKVEVKKGSFRPRRTVDMKNLSESDEATRSVLEKQGWEDQKKIKQILESGDSFTTKELQPGDKLYGFNTAGRGKDIQSSAYWIDDAGYQDVQSKFCKDGVWNKEGVKNYLALPCYNRADAIDVAEVTQHTTVVEAKVGKATELIQYTDNSGYTTGLMGKIMPGGGDQVTATPTVLKTLSGH